MPRKMWIFHHLGAGRVLWELAMVPRSDAPAPALKVDPGPESAAVAVLDVGIGVDWVLEERVFGIM
ncbi:hypothetical protein RRF57_002873 [Xylaria bambusicola]|uniref:Uncharacterized protein n=1 Tax=Xylaria bambusicola TaxID=326684 RepID=A0AAN7UDS2_9PEZI